MKVEYDLKRTGMSTPYSRPYMENAAATENSTLQVRDECACPVMLRALRRASLSVFPLFFSVLEFGRPGGSPCR